jgi:hypothetical protein
VVSALSAGGLADVVVPIALAVKREQLAHELWHYKYDVDPSVRARLTMRLGAVLWRFLGQHEKHIAGAAPDQVTHNSPVAGQPKRLAGLLSPQLLPAARRSG